MQCRGNKPIMEYQKLNSSELILTQRSTAFVTLQRRCPPVVLIPGAQSLALPSSIYVLAGGEEKS